MLWGYIAIISYLITTIWIGVSIFKLNESPFLTRKLPTLGLGACALVLHALALYQNTLTDGGINLGFYNALSLISWVVALLVILVSTIKPTDNLALIFLPAAALALLLELLMPNTYFLPESLSTGLRLHILLSITAYSLLTIAAVQAIIFAIQERQLRNKHPTKSMRLLPPMQSMEDLLIQMLAIGFFLLSLSLSSGLMFVSDIFNQHLSHKIVFSILAWFIFGLVLWGRWAWGWRGRKLIRWTLGGFSLLILAYLGSKLVYEFIL
ncbi:MAG: cytochrome c biogenesis protein CcsA [Gammaproteobacteria bacterium]|nr:cytochrome c biogenesis protein CcsA [Gammaproteobacteria bacterium]